MRWISVEESLPIFGHKNPIPKSEWVPVTDGYSRWGMARYTYGKFGDCWEMWEDDEQGYNCAQAGDILAEMEVEDIKFWIDIWNHFPKNLSDRLEKLVNQTIEDHKKILDDWFKAILSYNYQEHGQVSPMGYRLICEPKTDGLMFSHYVYRFERDVNLEEI